jgi:hypothetical protein
MSKDEEKSNMTESKYSTFRWDVKVGEEYAEETEVWEETTCLKCFEKLSSSHECSPKHTARKELAQEFEALVRKRFADVRPVEVINIIKVVEAYKMTKYLSHRSSHQSSSDNTARKKTEIKAQEKISKKVAASRKAKKSKN